MSNANETLIGAFLGYNRRPTHDWGDGDSLEKILRVRPTKPNGGDGAVALRMTGQSNRAAAIAQFWKNPMGGDVRAECAATLYVARLPFVGIARVIGEEDDDLSIRALFTVDGRIVAGVNGSLWNVSGESLETLAERGRGIFPALVDHLRLFVDQDAFLRDDPRAIKHVRQLRAVFGERCLEKFTPGGKR